jgi:pimeloyl-ACP methyl ester carboxylesterase
LAVESVDDAAAIFHGLALRKELDLHRIGVLGQGLGGIVVSCLARRTDQIARLCLLAPVTTGEVLSRLGTESEEELAQRLGAPVIPPGFFDGLDSLTPAVDLVTHDRPTLIVHGAADRIVPPESSLAYRDAIASAGRQVEHVLVAMGDHVFSNVSARAACLKQLTSFFAAAGRTEAAAGRS